MANNTCPYCGTKGSLVNVGYLIDSGTTNTSTIGMGLDPDDGLSPAFLWSTSSSVLAQRFAIPTLPGDVTIWNFIGWSLLTIPITAYIVVSWMFPDYSTYEWTAKWTTYVMFGLSFGAVPGMMAAVGLQHLVFKAKKEQRRKFEWCYRYLRESTYCARCNTAYDLWHSGYPEEFVQKKFDLSNYD